MIFSRHPPPSRVILAKRGSIPKPEWREEVWGWRRAGVFTKLYETSYMKITAKFQRVIQ